MVVSEAKLQANRRNAQRSSGPRTEEGKRRSSQNAVTDGLRAEALVILDEDPQALEDRRVAWRACLLPGDDVEERLVDSAVVHTWLQDRARRAQVARLNVNIVDFGVDEAMTNEKEVDDLGRRLFKDRPGPLVFYPSSQMTKRFDFSRAPSTSSAGKTEDDPDRPAALVIHLQSTLLGCEWLLGEWAGLKAILDRGQAWVSSDKLKAVRLLGKQPFDAIDDRDVAMVFLASFVLKKDKGAWYWEIATEMAEEDTKRFRNSAAVRELDSLMPEDAAKAREALLEIIERATERLKLKADAHRERARVKAAMAADCLAFDDSPQGERLRRFELASGRGLSRSLDDLRKHRRTLVSGPFSVVSSPLSVVSGPLSVDGSPSSVACCGAEGVTEAFAPNEPTVVREIVTNEPTAVQEISPNEPTDAREIVTNEPTGAGENVTNEPTVAGENVTSEPTAAQTNVTNEPTVAQINATNEPTVAGENVTNEPTEALDSVSVQSLELSASSNNRGGQSLQAEADHKQAWDSYRKRVERRKAMRAESLRKLNEEARRVAVDAIVVGRAHRRNRRSKNCKPGGQPKAHAAQKIESFE